MTKRTVQDHHVSYDPEWKELMYKGEHWIISQLQRRRNHSWGFLRAMRVMLIHMEKTAVELPREEGCNHCEL